MGEVAHVGDNEVGPSPDSDEFAIGAGDFDVSRIGGYPVRLIVIAAGSGTLKYKCVNTIGNSDASTWRTASSLVKNDQIGPGRITLIAGTTNGSSPGLTIRVYK